MTPKTFQLVSGFYFLSSDIYIRMGTRRLMSRYVAREVKGESAETETQPKGCPCLRDAEFGEAYKT